MNPSKILTIYSVVFLTVFSLCLLGDYLSKTHTYQENHTSTVINKHEVHQQQYHCTMHDDDGVCTAGYYTYWTDYYLDLQDGSKQKVSESQYDVARNGDTWRYTDSHTTLKPGEDPTPRQWTILPPVLAVGVCATVVIVSGSMERARRIRLKEREALNANLGHQADDENPWHLPLIKQHKYTEEEIIEMAPRPDNVNPKYLRKESRFSYAMSGGMTSSSVDLTPKEPIFIPATVAPGPSGKPFVPPTSPIPRSVDNDELIQ